MEKSAGITMTEPDEGTVLSSMASPSPPSLSKVEVNVSTDSDYVYDNAETKKLIDLLNKSPLERKGINMVDEMTPLLVNKADPNAMNDDGLPLLHMVNDRQQLVLLLDHNADPNKMSSKGDFWIENLPTLRNGIRRTHKTRQYPFPTIFLTSMYTELKRRGFNPNATNSRGEVFLETVSRLDLGDLLSYFMYRGFIRIPPSVLQIEHPCWRVVQYAIRGTMNLYWPEEPNSEHSAFLERAISTVEGDIKKRRCHDAYKMSIQIFKALVEEKIRLRKSFVDELIVEQHKKLVATVKKIRALDYPRIHCDKTMSKYEVKLMFYDTRKRLLDGLCISGGYYTPSMIEDTLIPEIHPRHIIYSFALIYGLNNSILTQHGDPNHKTKLQPEEVAEIVRHVIWTESHNDKRSIGGTAAENIIDEIFDVRHSMMVANNLAAFIKRSLQPESFKRISHLFRLDEKDRFRNEKHHKINTLHEYNMYLKIISQTHPHIMDLETLSPHEKCDCIFNTIFSDMCSYMSKIKPGSTTLNIYCFFHLNTILSYNGWPHHPLCEIKSFSIDNISYFNPHICEIITTIVMIRNFSNSIVNTIPNELLFHIFSFFQNHSCVTVQNE
jgi:hypothetical protein